MVTLLERAEGNFFFCRKRSSSKLYFDLALKNFLV